MQLSRERITYAALEILKEFGLADVSMRRVATSLSVAPGALYWHIANKQDLIASMAEVMLAPLFDGPVPGPQQLSDQLREVALSRRDGAEVLLAAVSQPEAQVREALADRFVAAVGRECAQGTSKSNRHAAALGLMHLTLGDAMVHQSAAQLAEVVGGVRVDEERAHRLHQQAVSFLLNGLDHVADK